MRAKIREQVDYQDGPLMPAIWRFTIFYALSMNPLNPCLKGRV